MFVSGSLRLFGMLDCSSLQGIHHVILLKHIFKHIFGEIISLPDVVWEGAFRVAGGNVILRNFRKMELCVLNMVSYSKVALE